MLIFFTYYLRPLHLPMAELYNFNRNNMGLKDENIYYLTLCKIVCQHLAYSQSERTQVLTSHWNK